MEYYDVNDRARSCNGHSKINFILSGISYEQIMTCQFCVLANFDMLNESEL